MSEKELAHLLGYDFATGRVRPISEGTDTYKQQPYMPSLLTIQRVLLAFGAQSVSVVEHKDSCGGRKTGWHKGICDCGPDVILHFRDGETYRYRTTEPDAERFLRGWLDQTGVR